VDEADHDHRIAAMFDRIAPRYDMLNRVLSFGADLGWRRRAVALARLGPGERALDIGAGTGDLAFALLANSAPSASVVGVDISPRMLSVSVRRADRLPVGGRYDTLLASAEDLPLPDGSIDRVISGFTLRNIGDLPRAFRELRRVLRPSGRVVLLELSHPTDPIFAALYHLYFDHILPPVASALGGDVEAYRYLPRSLRAFPGAEELAELMHEAGFARVRFEGLTMGVAAIHVGET
jgi:demethylmenaquinone methyltransferase/2-methoxy-6-polyprenyl-1,4-benzoquinol methylase